MDRRTIKQQAKDAIRGKWLMLFVVLLIVGFLSGIIFFIAPVLAFGVYLVVIDLLDNKDVDANRFLGIFKDLNHCLKLLGVALLVALFVAVGTFLFVIPGIIFAYQYSQALYIMMDNPEISATDALKRSKEMMRGYKFDLFIFQLSYIGHFLLTVITFGIYGVYFAPLYTVATVNYYKHLKIERLNVVDVEVL